MNEPMPNDPDEALAPRRLEAWQSAALALGLVVLALCGAYWSTLSAMVDTWLHSNTFAHGFAVPLIGLWLIWRDKGRLSGISPQPAWWVLILVAAAGLAWLLGNVGEVNSLAQLAIVSMLVFLVPCVAGLAVTRELLFPLCFILVFTVPMGDFLLPHLMGATADFTVAALRLTGVPVYREGQQLVIPSGHWSVVEACSGIRYLIASLMVGTLYAYLNYRSLRRRIGFVIIAGLVPLVANWLRAYIIVMLGHLSSNRIATGVDHLIYGWVFFGFVMALMFWIGSFWHEVDAPVEEAPLPPSGAVASRSSFWMIAVAVLLVAFLPRGLDIYLQGRPLAAPARIAPLDVPGWQVSDGGLTNWRPEFRGAADEAHRSFRRNGQAVGVYVAFYRNQDRDHKLVSSSNVLAGIDGAGWTRVSESGLSVPLGTVSVSAMGTDLRNPRNEERLVAWRWYWIGGRLTANDYLAKAYTALVRLTGEGDDSAAIVVYAPRGRPGEAEAVLAAFLAEAAPRLESALSATRGER